MIVYFLVMNRKRCNRLQIPDTTLKFFVLTLANSFTKSSVKFIYKLQQPQQEQQFRYTPTVCTIQYLIDTPFDSITALHLSMLLIG